MPVTTPTALAVVIATSPLTVTLDGDTAIIPARNYDSGYSPTIGDRVRVQLDTPRAPIITSVLT